MFCLYTLPLARPAQAKIQMLTTAVLWSWFLETKLIWVIFTKAGTEEGTDGEYDEYNEVNDYEGEGTEKVTEEGNED